MTQTIQTANHEQIADTVREFIVEQFLYDQPTHQLTNETPLIQEGVIDSLQIMQLVTFLQERFDYTVQPPELQLENFQSVNTVAALVSQFGENNA